MGVLVGLILGAGLLLIWRSAWVLPPTLRAEPIWHARTRDLLIQAGMELVPPGGLLALSGALAVLFGAVLAGLTQSIPIAFCFAALIGLAPFALVKSRARRRRSRLGELWPEVIDNLASAVRAGLSLPEAVSQLARRGPVELRPQFAQFARDYQASGRFEECLDLLKFRMADPVADRIVESLRLAREVGGTDLGRLLRTLSSFLREDFRTRGELEARQSWTVAGARMAAAGPWVVLAFLSTRPETAAAYNSVMGGLILLFGAVCSAVAYQAMLRIGRLPEDVRVFR